MVHIEGAVLDNGINYKIDGIDLFTSVGFLADVNRATSNSIEQPANVSEVFSHTWDDGFVEYDLVTIPGDQPRKIRIEGHLYATSEADYRSKKSSLEVIRKKPYSTIYSPELDSTINAKFESFSTWQRLTPIKGQTKIVTKIAMDFNEVLGIALPTYSIYYGPSDTIPNTAAQVTALNSGEFANEITMDTGTTKRIMNIAIQTGRTIVSTTDLDSVFGAVTYTQRGTVTIAGNSYNIYSLELGLPYQPSHRHKFIIS